MNYLSAKFVMEFVDKIADEEGIRDEVARNAMFKAVVEWDTQLRSNLSFGMEPNEKSMPCNDVAR